MILSNKHKNVWAYSVMFSEDGNVSIFSTTWEDKYQIDAVSGRTSKAMILMVFIISLTLKFLQWCEHTAKQFIVAFSNQLI